ncbi:MAG TPA: extracellular solute-binding protein, partial [Stellaceae bacterium]|nr:extracellular solute-binding protein [Stellaceae bacterium]
MVAALLAGLLLAGPAFAAPHLTLCHGGHPVTTAASALLAKWARREGIALKIETIPFDQYLPRMTRALMAGNRACDILWHNDDWSDAWKSALASTQDVAGMEEVELTPLDVFRNEEGEVTVVPMVHTVGVFFYRRDLLRPEEVPQNLTALLEISLRLQREGKVRWGYVGAMSAGNAWFSLWWTLWNNGCDLFAPAFVRENAVLAAAGWRPMIDDPCSLEIVEFWWDALHRTHIAPETMTGFGRAEANAVFAAGDAAFTVADSTFLKELERSKIAGSVGVAPFPVGDHGTGPVAWNDIWGWAIPKAISPQRRKLAKKLLGDFLTDTEGQVALSLETGAPPASRRARARLIATDPLYQALEHAAFEARPIHSAYYFPRWPSVETAYSEI